MWDNSNMQEDIEWGNIPVGNMSDEELYKKNYNYLDANREKANDPEFIKKLSSSIKQSYVDKPEQLKNKLSALKKANEKKFNDPEYLKNLKIQRQKQAKDPAYLEKLHNGLEKIDRVEWKEKLLEGQKKRNADTNWKKNISLAQQEKRKDPIFVQKMFRTKAYAIKTPDTILNGLDQGHLFYNKLKNFNNGRKWLLGMMKKYPNEYYKISWEEYDKLTKK